jgi:hypothetical protein
MSLIQIFQSQQLQRRNTDNKTFPRFQDLMEFAKKFKTIGRLQGNIKKFDINTEQHLALIDSYVAYDRKIVTKMRTCKRNINNAKSFIIQFFQTFFAQRIARQVCPNCSGIGCLSQKKHLESIVFCSGKYEFLFDCSNCGKFKLFNSPGFHHYNKHYNSQIMPYKSRLDIFGFHYVEPSIIIEQKYHMRVISNDMWHIIHNYDNGTNYKQFDVYQELFTIIRECIHNVNVSSISIDYIMDIGVIYN